MGDKCFYCSALWGNCTCKFKGEFEWNDFVITTPTVTECGRFFVENPYVYYGRAFSEAITSGKLEVIC